MSMTEHKNTNPFDEQPNPGNGDGDAHDSDGSDDAVGSAANGHGHDGRANKADMPKEGDRKSRPSNPDDDWEMFMSEHADDMGSIEQSRNAKKFERHVQREQKKAALNVRDLKADSFAGARGAGHGPRDFTGSSWLDTEDVMDQGNDFIPPNPAIGPVRKTTLIYVAFVVLGVLALAGAILLSQFASVLGTIGGLLTILGAAGLFYQHRGHTETRSDPFDDGSRV